MPWRRYFKDNMQKPNIDRMERSDLVFGPTLELVYKYSPELNTVGLISMKALALTDVEVLPHYSRYLSRFDRFEERCKEYEKENNKRVIRINDGDAVFIIGDEKK